MSDPGGKPCPDDALVECVCDEEDHSLLEGEFVGGRRFVLEVRPDVEGVARTTLKNTLVVARLI